MSTDSNNFDVTRSSPPNEPTPDITELTGKLPPRNYVPGGEVARGGMGAVLYAKDLNLRRSIAMKVVLTDREVSAESMLRFVEEAQVTGQLEHPNIVPIHDLGVSDDGLPFYTMKFVKGVTLKEVLSDIATGKSETVAKYPLAHLLTIFQKVCDAVAFAHSKGVIHRDLKPENIMIGEFGEVLVMDWGLAKVLTPTGQKEAEQKWVVQSARATASGDSSIYVTMDGMIMGSPQFMAPEQAEGHLHRIDARTDIFALGGILYNILALQTPFTGKTLDEILEKVRRCEIQPVSKTAVLPHLPGGQVPESLAAVVEKAMAWEQKARYQSVPELQREIEAYQGGFATAAEEAGAWRQFSLMVKRHKAASIGIAAAFLIGVTFGTQAVVAGRRAQLALAELRSTAPTFAAQASSLIENQKFDEALEKIGIAIKLDGKNPDYHLFRANTLQALTRLPEAVTAYRQVLVLRSNDAAAQKNLELCEKLLAENAGKAELTAPLKTKLLDAILAQKRQADAVPLSRELKRDTDTAETTIKSRLKAVMAQPGWNAKRLVRLPDGTFQLGLRGVQVTDISFLTGLPISDLGLDGCAVTDLQPLRQIPTLRSLHLYNSPVRDFSVLHGLKLNYLSLSTTSISDLSPLAGMPLEKLDLTSCGRVSDFTPLRGMPLKTLFACGTSVSDLRPLRESPLEFLAIYYTKVENLDGIQKLPLRELLMAGQGVADLSPLRGSPVKDLDLQRCWRLRDFSPLLDCPKLERLVLPTHTSDFLILTNHPSLKRIYYANQIFGDNGIGWNQLTSVTEFWKQNRDRLARQVPMEKQLEKFRQRLIAEGNPPEKVPRWAFDSNGDLKVSVQNLKCSDISELRGVAVTYFSGNSTLRDLSPLTGAPLRDVTFFGTTIVDDLTPIRDAPLEHFTINASGVRDISFLRGKPLRTVTLTGSRVEDVAPLADCPALEELVLPGGAKNIELLKRLPKLRYIGYKWDSTRNRPDKTTAEFWKEFDAKKGPAPK